jgi:hypothetical protein
VATLVPAALCLAFQLVVLEKGQLDESASAAGPETPASPGRLSPQERLEANAWGRWLVRSFLALTVTAVVVWNFPGSGIRTGVLPVVERYINATGLTQTWNLFAPDPTDNTSEFVARISFADGTSVRWHPPRGGDVVGEYRTYHWAVFADRLRSDGWRQLREPFARWLARTHTQGGREPVQVELISRSRPNLAPGTDGPPPPLEQSVLFTLDLRSAGPR